MNTTDREIQTPVCIFLANRPRMIRQMLRRAIQRIPDLKVVGESNRMQSVFNALKTINVDWLVVSLTDKGEIPQQYASLADEYPSLKVLGMSLDGNELELKDSQSKQKRKLHDVSLKTLISLFQKGIRIRNSPGERRTRGQTRSTTSNSTNL